MMDPNALSAELDSELYFAMFILKVEKYHIWNKDTYNKTTPKLR